MMRVALDTSALYTTQAGIARHIRGLLAGLRLLTQRDERFIEFAWDVINLEYHQPQRAFKTIYRELIWAKLLAPGKLRRLKIDLLHSPGAVLISPPRTIRHVATLHDLAVLRYPERFRPWHRWSSKRQFLRVLTADRVICISRFT